MKGVLVLLLTVTLLGHASAAPDPFIFDIFNYFLSFIGLGSYDSGYGYNDYGPDPYLDGGYGGNGFVNSQYLARSGTVPEQNSGGEGESNQESEDGKEQESEKESASEGESANEDRKDENQNDGSTAKRKRNSGGEGEKNTESEGESEQDNGKGDTENESGSEVQSEKEDSKAESENEESNEKKKRNARRITNSKETRRFYEWLHHPSADNTNNKKRQVVASWGTWRRPQSQMVKRAAEETTNKEPTLFESIRNAVDRLLPMIAGDNSLAEAPEESNTKKRHVESFSDKNLGRLMLQMVKRAAEETTNKEPTLFESIRNAVDRLLPMIAGDNSLAEAPEESNTKKRHVESSSDKNLGRLMPQIVKRAAEETTNKEPTLFESIRNAVDRLLPMIAGDNSLAEAPEESNTKKRHVESLSDKNLGRLMPQIVKRAAEETTNKEPTLFESIRNAVDRLLPMIAGDNSLAEAPEESNTKKRHVESSSDKNLGRLMPQIVKRAAEETTNKEPTLFESIRNAVDRLLPMIAGDNSLAEAPEESNTKKRHVESLRDISMRRLMPQIVKRAAEETKDKEPTLFESIRNAVDRLLPMIMDKRSVEEGLYSIKDNKYKRSAKARSEKDITLYENIIYTLDRFLPTIVTKRSAEESSLFENFLITMRDRLLRSVNKRSTEESSEKEPTLIESIVNAVDRLLPKATTKRSADGSAILENFLTSMAERILSEVVKRSTEERSANEHTLHQNFKNTMPMITSKRSVEASSGAEVTSFENHESSAEIDEIVRPVTRLDLYNRILNDRSEEVLSE